MNPAKRDETRNWTPAMQNFLTEYAARLQAQVAAKTAGVR